jgi:CRP-like cAMP-binding protein
VRLGRGDFFGERALLERVRRAASVIAIEPGRVFVLARRDFDALLASDIAFRSRVQAALAYRDELRDMPLFHDLAPREVDALVARLVPRSVRCGETIIRQGEVGDRFYVIRSGRLRVERDGVVLTDLGPGEAFGEIALLFDVPRTATVVAVEDARLLGLDAQDFRDVLAGYLGRARDLERLSHLRLSTHRRLDEVVK